MGVQRIMGIETEYGVSSPGDPNANPMVLSSQLVNSYAGPHRLTARRARWDYASEAPLRDARGWELERGRAEASQLTDFDDPASANVIVSNGARLYVDHAHPEYSSPEVTTARDAVLWDKAGEYIMRQAAQNVAAEPGLNPINLYKNNTDNKGASYGTHENYLMDRTTAFADIVRYLTPFLVSRQVFTGAGRVGMGQDGTGVGYQISQRADFFEAEVGLETTLKRPIINTRDEPHAQADRYRRLHVIIGDATMSEVATLLKMGTTALVLELVEHGGFTDTLTLAHPVGSVHAISHDPTLRHAVPLIDGPDRTALQIQRWYLAQVEAYLDRTYGNDRNADTTEIMVLWAQVLDSLERDVMSCADTLDWVAKLRVIQGYVDRDGLAWNAHRLQLVDLQWSDIRLDKGLYNRMASQGRMRRLFTDTQIEHAVTAPPTDTRAYFRGECVRRYPHEVVAASWDCVIFDLPGHDSLQRVPTTDPHRGTQQHVQALFESSPTATDLINALGSA